MRESEKKLVSLFSSIPLGIFTVNERGKIEETYSNYLGYLLGESEYKEKTFTEVLFGPIESSLTRCERKGIENIAKCLNREERHFSELVDTFPALVYYHDKNKKESGKYLQIFYKPLCYDGG